MKTGSAHGLNEQFRQALLQRDAVAIAELYTPDAVLYDVGPELEHRGRDDIRRHFESVFATLVPSQVDLRAEVTEVGDLAWAHGTGTILAQTEQGEAMPPLNVRIMDIRRRDADGNWRIVLDHISMGAG